jgi:tetratricopeptide (TPR) repeat protein
MNHPIRALCFAALFAVMPSIGEACVWSYGTALNGAKVSVNGLGGAEIVKDLNHFDPRADWEKRRKSLASRVTQDDLTRNNLAVALLHLGDVSPAIALLQQIEREHPGSYVTAANLGTAYELAGDDRAALQWIREAIARNPGSHEGTEWLHVRILEAKLALRADPRWLQSHSILGVDFGTAVIPKLPKQFATHDGRPLKPEEVAYALWYQLDERYQFVHAPDPIVGSLLVDWGNLLLRTETLESAAALYREALRFGTPGPELTLRRLRRVEQTLRDAKMRR